MLPRITIIAPCRNGAPTVAEAVDSIRAQHYSNLEHILLDACSTDGTLAVLQRYPEVTVIGEPDEGSHDAMNRGVARASGEVVGFLNVDDLYPPGTLDSVGRLFADDPALDVVIGGPLMLRMMAPASAACCRNGRIAGNRASGCRSSPSACPASMDGSFGKRCSAASARSITAIRSRRTAVRSS